MHPLLRHFGRRNLACALLMAATLPPSRAQEQDLPLPTSEEVVKMAAFNVSTDVGRYHEDSSSMATKVATPMKELASSLQILNFNAITDRNATNLQDVYPYVVGMTQFQKQVNGFTFRGFPTNGALTQNVQYDGLQGSAALNTPSAANVESLEFLKGPNSVLYGQMQPGGLLNIVSKSPKSVQQTTIRTSIATYAGAYNDFGSTNSYSAQLDTTGPLGTGKHWLYRFIINTQSLHPFRPGDYDRGFFVYPSLTYKWSQETYLTVKLESIESVQRNDEGLLPVFGSTGSFGPTATYRIAPLNTVYQEPTDTFRDKGESAAAIFRSQLSENWLFRAQTRSVWHTDSTHFMSQTNGTINTSNLTLTRQYNLFKTGHRYNYFDTNLTGTMGSDNFHHTIVAGVGGGYEFSNTERFAFGPNVAPISIFNPILGVTPYPANGTRTSSSRVTFSSLGEYLFDQMRLWQIVHLTLGIRHDQQGSHGIDVYNPATSPYVHQFLAAETAQAGLVVDVTRQLSAYASWSQSYRPNTVTSVDASGRAGFPPERGEQFETGLKFQNADRSLFASLAGYEITRTNVAAATGTNLPTGQAIFRLDGEQIGRGVEFEAQWLPVPYWQVQTGFSISKTYISASIRNPAAVGMDLVNAPRQTANLWTRYNVPSGNLKGFGAGLGLIYVGKMWGGDPTTAIYFQVPGWTRVDGALYYKYKRYEFALNVQNALDRNYVSAPRGPRVLLPGDARKLTLNATVHW
ncbi:MAG: Iron complex outerrane recepter protein [Verrucomicrobia bacterium]|nr:Iron complex outerrane recepter protein [Verrucomicrobiota bacterium]